MVLLEFQSQYDAILARITRTHVKISIHHALRKPKGDVMLQILPARGFFSFPRNGILSPLAL